MRNRRCVNCITPPHILNHLLKHEDEAVRKAALSTMLTTTRLRGERSIRALLGGVSSTASGGRRTIYDCVTEVDLSTAKVIRWEDGGGTGDPSVNQAFDGLGATRDFYRGVFGRDSIDDRGMRLDAYVHRGVDYNNAFWNGRAMVFGDGDRLMFTDFTGSVDVIGHELSHGVTEFSAGLEYHNQPGALNESLSDVFGSLVKQWSLRQSAAKADWLIGADIFTPGVAADALRSLKAPGTAYDNSDFGKDPQPAHMSDFVRLRDTEEEDWGGVHINSGIPNHAFYLTATELGGNAWEAPGHVWYEALRASNPKTDFQQFADTTYLKALQLYGQGSAIQRALTGAWESVGIRVSPAIRAGADGQAAATAASGEDLTGLLTTLIKKVDTLTRKVNELKKP